MGVELTALDLTQAEFSQIRDNPYQHHSADQVTWPVNQGLYNHDLA